MGNSGSICADKNAIRVQSGKYSAKNGYVKRRFIMQMFIKNKTLVWKKLIKN